jgi:hypothetical protein
MKMISNTRNNKINEQTSLLATSTTNGTVDVAVAVTDKSVVKRTVADLFVNTPKLFMFYHVIGTPYDMLSPIGFILGGIVHSIGLYKPFPTIIQTMTTSSIVLACVGSTIGTVSLCNTIYKGDSATPVPWNDRGIHKRVTGLSKNNTVRVMDQSVWSGIALAGLAFGTASIVGKPLTKYIPLGSGALGTIQALQLGAVTGSLYGFTRIALGQQKKDTATNNEG